jgi:hypothetical protein
MIEFIGQYGALILLGAYALWVSYVAHADKAYRRKHGDVRWP